MRRVMRLLNYVSQNTRTGKHCQSRYTDGWCMSFSQSVACLKYVELRYTEKRSTGAN